MSLPALPPAVMGPHHTSCHCNGDLCHRLRLIIQPLLIGIHGLYHCLIVHNTSELVLVHTACITASLSITQQSLYWYSQPVSLPHCP